MKRSSIDRVRESFRLQQIYNVFLRYGGDMLISRYGIINGFHDGLQRWIWQLPSDLPEVPLPVKVRLMIEELGPTYVKMGQIVSSQASVIPAEWEEQLEKLQSEVPPFPSEQVRETIIEELGAPPEVLYGAFELRPFAAASTAQVHRATLHNGDQVVVKVQRPHIQQQMKADLGIMQNAARVASGRSEQLQAIDLVGMLEQFSTSVLAELDYTGEAYNAFRLADVIENIEGARIPTIYPEFSTARILTMEFVNGVKISDLDAIDAAGLDRAKLARTALRTMIKQLLIDGFFHADPHPGNVLVNLETGDLTFIDTGMVGELGFSQRLNVIQLILALQQQDITSQAQILRNMSVPFLDHVDDQAYIRNYERRVGKFKYRDTVPFGEVINMSFDLLREHGLRLNPDLTMGIKALMQAESMATLLFPQGGIVDEGSAIVREMVLDEIDADKMVDVAKKQLTMSAREVFQRIPSLQEATVKWLDQYQKGRFEIHLDTTAVSEEVRKVSRYGRLGVIALLLVGMLIGSAIASTVLVFNPVESPMWDLFFRIAYLGYVFAMLIAGLIVLRLIWRWMRGNDPVGD